ncbi:helix-turn-helix domain-containing protein [Pseudorhodoplanes sp.]|uniref:helix-turn-helix domain-containing protein n=1 Tax=Pseudorhodoplanes sp. TaxID=1934341 RepID=UPI00391A2F0E
MNGQRSIDAMVAPPLFEGWLTDDRVAAEIGVSRYTLRRWERRRVGPPRVRIGRKVLYRAEAFREWLVSRERHPVSKGARPGGGR